MFHSLHLHLFPSTSLPDMPSLFDAPAGSMWLSGSCCDSDELYCVGERLFHCLAEPWLEPEGAKCLSLAAVSNGRTWHWDSGSSNFASYFRQINSLLLALISPSEGSGAPSFKAQHGEDVRIHLWGVLWHRVLKMSFISCISEQSWKSQAWLPKCLTPVRCLRHEKTCSPENEGGYWLTCPPCPFFSCCFQPFSAK